MGQNSPWSLDSPVLQHFFSKVQSHSFSLFSFILLSNFSLQSVMQSNKKIVLGNHLSSLFYYLFLDQYYYLECLPSKNSLFWTQVFLEAPPVLFSWASPVWELFKSVSLHSHSLHECQCVGEVCSLTKQTSGPTASNRSALQYRDPQCYCIFVFSLPL